MTAAQGVPRRRRAWAWGAVAGVVALGVGAVLLLPAAGLPQVLPEDDVDTWTSVPADTGISGPTSSGVADAAAPSPTTPTVAEATAPPAPTYPTDRVDRAWPRNPPWDACPRPVWPGKPSEGSPGEGERVLVIGDSLTRESRAATMRLMKASGWTPTFRCWGSKRMDWGLEQLKRARSLDQLPTYVVVAMGTNDVSWEQPAVTERRVRTMLDRLGPKRQVLWVDLDVAHSAFSTARAAWFNRMIRDVAKDRPNVTVVPWERLARERRVGRFDGIHYGADGYRLRAKVVTDSLNKRARAVARAAAAAQPASSMKPVPLVSPTPDRAPTPSPVSSATEVPEATSVPDATP